MKEKNMRFGELIKFKRLKDPRELSLKDVSSVLNISLSFLSDIEQGRRKPFDDEKIERFCAFLGLTDEDKALLYDLAARERRAVPGDIDDIMMYSEIGEMARFALRMSNAGIADENDWREFIRKIEKKRGARK